MKKVIGFILLLATLSACNLGKGGDKYFIEGTIKNAPVKSIVLQKVTMEAVTSIDTTAINDKGEFKMTGVSETGFYRLLLNNKETFFFLLQPGKYNFSIDAQSPVAFTVTGPADNDDFQRAYKSITKAKNDYSTWAAAYEVYSRDGTSQDTLAILTHNVQAAGSKLVALLRDSSQAAHNPMVAMFYVTNAPYGQFPEQYAAIYQRMQKEIPTSAYTKELGAMIAQAQAMEKQRLQQQQMPQTKVKTGDQAPDIALKTPDGKEIKLSSLKGKVVLLDFWASWCKPCRQEMPNVVAAYKKYKDKGFTVYSVSLDKDVKAWKKAIDDLDMIWPNHVSDLKEWKSDVAAVYGVQAIPQPFLLDKNGVVVTTELRGDLLDKKLAELLK